MGGKGPCVFCQQKDEGISDKTLVLHIGKFSMAVLNKFPYNSGHMLILPNRHEGDILKLSDDEYFDLNTLLKKSIAIVKKVFLPGAINIGVNMGADAGAGLPGHLHYHIVPRWKGDTNFFPIISKSKVLPSTLETVYSKLSPHFKDMN